MVMYTYKFVCAVVVVVVVFLGGGVESLHFDPDSLSLL